MFPPGSWAQHFWVLQPQAADQSPHQAREVATVHQGRRKPTKGPWTNQRAEKRPRAPPKEIRVIVWGNTMAGSSKKAWKTYLCMVQRVQISGWLPKVTRVNSPTINSSEENARWLHHPHDDTLVINLSIVGFNTRQVLVDNRSSKDIIYYPAFQYMGIDKEHFLPSNMPLVGFGGTNVFPVGTITLS